MRLADLLTELPSCTVHGDPYVAIAGVTHDSREVGPGFLFCAIPGVRYDGHDFTAEAAQRGAAALLVQRRVEVALPQAVVPSVREAIGPVASAYWGHPSRALRVIGVTGTNGKGAVTYLTRAVLEAGGITCGIIGTIGAVVGGRRVSLRRTTPEAPELQQLLASMRDASLAAVAMEVASHALAMERVGGVRFVAAGFTNLTQDHLDFHGTMEAYRAAKARLFERVEADGVSVINRDDPHGVFMASRSRAPVVTYGLGDDADVRAQGLEMSARGCAFEVLTPVGRAWFSIPIAGMFNVYNALCAVALGLHCGVPLDAMADALRAFPGIPGRFELVDAGQPFAVVVDYAHTPDGLDNVLRTARQIAHGRLIAVFGCGGDRDPAKRPEMGRIAVRLADHVVVTSDNPRSENPMAIIEDIVAGIRGEVEDLLGRPALGTYEVEPDRRAAIRRAIAMARPGDIVVICGKGHEDYQILRDRTIPFDDREEARQALASVQSRA
ncbi:MAG: UDP-N-acetylmuramoyl-L-alanyl-D-glutamate--2,6-diaminopimelate ligase [Armatimonadota bacterium]|nr:UDP-N-acetylmuramoyl-L-alanyl-D-glutamate--2,6-diaminopimelate ligase [Armatimonadota bacterium]MDR5696674.1 UDP-N-acetylmuramoyl-L-alanyl-D-glutamate--2,6-diaminopimelate ligase [Armatimonadota bacterium]